MLRFIISRSIYDAVSQMNDQRFETIDLDVPELELILRSGGHGEAGHDVPHLIGVEINPAPAGAALVAAAE